MDDSLAKGGANGLLYNKLIFSLAWFHSILVKRSRFQSLGWNEVYKFSEADFDISVMDMYGKSDSQKGENMTALRTIISECY